MHKMKVIGLSFVALIAGMALTGCNKGPSAAEQLADIQADTQTEVAQVEKEVKEAVDNVEEAVKETTEQIENVITQENYDKIVRDETTYEEVIQLFGEPSFKERLKMDDKETISAEWTDEKGNNLSVTFVDGKATDKGIITVGD